MEFADLGENCSEPMCNQLDFLPFKCDACMQIFCKHHYQYLSHNCKKAYLKEKQVPICPLCDKPFVCKNGSTPDETISNHIDNECLDDRAKNKRKNKIYTNRCSYKGCKQKELIQLLCPNCKLNHCLKHRHPVDHNCEENFNGNNLTRPSLNQERQQQHPFLSSSTAAKAAANAALQRLNLFSNNNSTTAATRNTTINTSRSSSSKVQAMQGTLSEDEALRKALQLSLSTGEQLTATAASNDRARLQEEEDRILAQAIEQSERDYNRSKDRCNVS